MAFYVIPEKREVTVGKSNSDLILANDSSISRKHCVLHIAAREACPKTSTPVKTRTGLWLVDSGSKYGTFLLSERDGDTSDPIAIPRNKPVVLQHGSVLRFGILQSVWCVEYRPFQICASCVPPALKEGLRANLVAIGGDLMPTCSQRCSYLVTCSITLTVKVLLAMIHGIPIVKPAFIDQLVKALRENRTWPDPREWRPTMAETAVRVEDVDLEPGHKRNTIFSGLKFYVRSPETLEKLEPVISAAGGSMAVLDALDLSLLLDKGAIMVDSSDTGSSQGSLSSQISPATTAIREFLERNGRRMVPDREIPLAIAYSSVSRMCNTGRDTFSSGPLAPPLMPIAISQSTVIEGATEPPDTQNLAIGGGVVNASCSQVDTNLSEAGSAKARYPVYNVDAPPEPPGERLSRMDCTESDFTSLPLAAASRKRVGSLDVFDEEQSRKRMLVGEGLKASSSVRSNDNMRASTSGSGLLSRSQMPDVSRDGRDEPRHGGGLLSRSQRCHSGGNAQDDEDSNPFGKRKERFEEGPFRMAKKTRTTSSSLTAVEDGRRSCGEDDLDNGRGSSSYRKSSSSAAYDDLTTSRSPPPDFQFQAPRRPPSSVSKPTLAESSTVPKTSIAGPSSILKYPPATSAIYTENLAKNRYVKPAEPKGWIDMSDRKEEEKSPGEALSRTIIMLSLVTLAYAHHQAAPVESSHGPRNVKVFHKKPFHDINRTVGLQPMPDFEEDCCRMTRSLDSRDPHES